ncbi:hypothetical protein BX616_000055 [Lobosporangium transversale]|nr:hypothetical protein BX616_000055 [Lobosporangium transversale]
MQVFPPLAISSIAVHNATSSPAFNITVLKNSTFVIRSAHERIEYVQDTVVAPTPSLPSISTDSLDLGSSAIPSSALSTTISTEASNDVLLLKVLAGEGFRLSFELNGSLLHSVSNSTQPTIDNNSNNDTTTTTSKANDNHKDPPVAQANEHPEESAGTQQEGSSVTASQDTTADHSTFDQSNNEGLSSPAADPIVTSPESGSTIGVTSAADVPEHVEQPTIYFASTDSESEMQYLCQTFDQKKNEGLLSVVGIQRGMPENNVGEQSSTQKSHNWTWQSNASNDYMGDDVHGHKTVFAFLYRNPVTGDVDILSQFAFWVINAQANAGVDRTGYRRPSAQTSPSNSRHRRQASAADRFNSGISRLPSFHSKGYSAPSIHNSTLSLPDASTDTGSGYEGSAPNSGSSSTLNSTSFSIDTEDGPLFRASVVECENHIRDMKASTKRIIKAAQSAMDARKAWIAADEAFIKEMEGFRPAEPLLNSYLRPVSQSLAATSDILAHQMRTLLIDPLNLFYTNDIKAAEMHRKSFEDESKEYYQFLSRYMGMKQDSNRKKSEADAKYEKKRKIFEIKRFEYWSFLLDMRVGGSKSDELLHHLTNYSEKHCRNLVDMALVAEDLKPGLDSIAADLLESQKRATQVRKERQERRKELFESHGEALTSISQNLSALKSGSASSIGVSTLAAAASSSHDLANEGLSDTSNTTLDALDDHQDSSGAADLRSNSGSSPNVSSLYGSSQANNTSTPRFSGIRDLEQQDIEANSALGSRKEGFLFATSRPSMHSNSVVLEKPSINWHKYWCVVSEGHLHEYSHWKKGAAMLHNDPINLKLSTVRPCRNQDRRFCFEVITPKFRRVYQATSTEDMNSWVSVISNAIQSLLNGNSSSPSLDNYLLSGKDSKGSNGINGAGSDGLSVKYNGINRVSMDQTLHERQSSNVTNILGDFQSLQDSVDTDHLGTRLLKIMREAHPANNFCAECGAKNPDWCAINLGILICIECSGIHRSLGTHISKVRSFTLDTTSYTRDLFEFIHSVGNEASNKIWEANLIQSTPKNQEGQRLHKVVFRRPLVNDTREYKVAFIQKKYVERAFVDKHRYTDNPNDSCTAEELAIFATKALFNAVEANNISEVIAAYAAGADLNAIQEVESENEPGSESDSDHVVTELTEEATGSEMVLENQARSDLDGLSIVSGKSSHSKSIEAPVVNALVVDSNVDQASSSDQSELQSQVEKLQIEQSQTEQSQSEQPPQQEQPQELPSPSNTDLAGSSFMVMQVSPLLLALRHSIPWSLDEQYEVYPMAEFMLQNGAASNLSVEVRLIDDDTDRTVQGASSDLVTFGNTRNDNSWDSAQVDPDDIRNHRQRCNRRSLGQVINMRGEGGASAMEYLRAKSVQRGESLPGSPPVITGNCSGYYEAGTIAAAAAAAAAAGLNSPPSAILSPRLRITQSSANSISAPASAHPSFSAPGFHLAAHARNQSNSIHQEISSLFIKRRESDSGGGSSIFAKGSESDKRSGSGVHKLQHSASANSSSLHAFESTAGPTSSSASSIMSHTSGYSSSVLQHSSSRAHKMKASLSKSLRLSAAYIKNNMMKEEKEHSTPVISAPSVSSTVSSIPPSWRQQQQEVSNNASSEALVSGATSSSTLMSVREASMEQNRAMSAETAEEPLSGPYILLHKKESNSGPDSNSNTNINANANTATNTNTSITSNP